MEATWASMQAEIDLQPMPPPAESGCPATVAARCNDCAAAAPSVPYHVLGCRCPQCGSFNTAISSDHTEVVRGGNAGGGDAAGPSSHDRESNAGDE